MILFREDNNSYVAYSAREKMFLADVELNIQDALLPQNKIVSEVKGKDNCLLMVLDSFVSLPNDHVSRYATDLFEGDLDIYKVKSQVMPNIKKGLVEAGLMNESDAYLKNTYVLAQNDEMFVFGGDGMEIIVVEDVYTMGPGSKTSKITFGLFKHLPIKERLQKIGLAMESIAQAGRVFPIVLTDTKSMQSVVIDRP